MKKLLNLFVILLAAALIMGFAGCDGGDDGNSNGEKVTISYNLNYEGAPAAPVSVEIDKGAAITQSNLPDVTREGYEFMGWHTASTGGTKVESTTTFSANATIYAQWKAEDDNGGEQGGNQGGDDSGIDFSDEANGTLRVINNTNKDMVIFMGQTPSASNILGGVRALTTKNFDVSDDVDDFGVGGYLILRGVTLDEYNANKTTLSNARIDYSAMATYGQGKKWSVEISPNYIGDYGFKVTNLGRIGMELRKDSPDGEKISYLPSLMTNQLIYSDSTNAFSIFPVYVYYSRSTGLVTTLKATSHFESVTATPRPLTADTMQSYSFPTDQTLTWAQIVGTLVSPVAYITITNNVPNQGAYVTIAGGNEMKSQNGYDAIGTGEMLTYELESTEAGQQKNLMLKLYNGAIMVPVKFENQETTYPFIKNGYDYTISLTFNGGSAQEVANYSATITESASPRDLSSEIDSL